MADITIYSATFHDGGVEVVYSEDRDMSDRVALQRVIAVPMDVAGEDLAEALDSLQEVVDLGLTYLTNPSRVRPSGISTKDTHVSRSERKVDGGSGL